jgi:hypothetical protein
VQRGLRRPSRLARAGEANQDPYPIVGLKIGLVLLWSVSGRRLGKVLKLNHKLLEKSRKNGRLESVVTTSSGGVGRQGGQLPDERLRGKRGERDLPGSSLAPA